MNLSVSDATCFSLSFCAKFIIRNLRWLKCFCFIRQDEHSNHTSEVSFYSIGIISKLQECSLFHRIYHCTSMKKRSSPSNPTNDFSLIMSFQHNKIYQVNFIAIIHTLFHARPFLQSIFNTKLYIRYYLLKLPTSKMCISACKIKQNPTFI